MDLATHVIALLAYAGLAIVLVFSRRSQQLGGYSLLLAAVLTAAWAGAVVWLPAGPVRGAFLPLAEVAKLGAWSLFLLAAIRALNGSTLNVSPRALAGDRSAQIVLGALLAAGLVASPVLGAGKVAGAPLAGLAHLALVLLGLVLVETLWRASRPRERWTFKPLVIGSGAVFAFELVHLSQTLLLPLADETTWVARPLVYALAMPALYLAAARISTWPYAVGARREAVWHTTILIGCGLYLLAVAGLATLMRQTGWTWGPALQLTSIVAAAGLLAAMVTSHTMRAWIRRYVASMFFELRFDYRKIWIETNTLLSGVQPDGRESEETLPQRAARALANVADCSAGAVYMRGTGDALVQTGTWQWPEVTPLFSLPRRILDIAEMSTTVVDLCGALTETEGREDAELLTRIAGEGWLLVPLRGADGDLTGLVLLGKPLSRRPLDWEDAELFEVLGRQVATVLGEAAATRRLAEVEQFARINKRFAFVAHDLKTLTGQLTVLLKAAEKHAGDPAFQTDVLATVEDSVAKMRTMLERLNAETDSGAAARIIDLGGLVAALAEENRVSVPNLHLLRTDPDLPVAVDAAAFAAVFGNLLQNAADASPDGCPIRLELVRENGAAVCRITDDGAGMTEDFIANQLFRPFATTKPGGYGIGMVQCRDLVETWGGTVAVDSAPGRGTTVTVRLPIAAPAAGARDAGATDASASPAPRATAPGNAPATVSIQ